MSKLNLQQYFLSYSLVTEIDYKITPSSFLFSKNSLPYANCNLIVKNLCRALFYITSFIKPIVSFRDFPFINHTSTNTDDLSLQYCPMLHTIIYDENFLNLIQCSNSSRLFLNLLNLLISPFCNLLDFSITFRFLIGHAVTAARLQTITTRYRTIHLQVDVTASTNNRNICLAVTAAGLQTVDATTSTLPPLNYVDVTTSTEHCLRKGLDATTSRLHQTNYKIKSIVNSEFHPLYTPDKITIEPNSR